MLPRHLHRPSSTIQPTPPHPQTPQPPPPNHHSWGIQTNPEGNGWLIDGSTPTDFEHDAADACAGNFDGAGPLPYTADGALWNVVLGDK